MDHFTGKFWVGTTYLATIISMLDFDGALKIMMTLGAMYLLYLQIKLHRIKIKKEKDNK